MRPGIDRDAGGIAGSLRRRWPAFLIIVYFLIWALQGLSKGFGGDDPTNLYAAWTRPLHRLVAEVFTVWSAQSRPVGGLFYLAVYAVAGFDPAPFHAACVAVLLASLILQYRVFLALTGSFEAAWAALLFGCFQGTMWDVYTSVAVVYDILCGAFCFAAFLVYLGGRRHSLARSALVLALTLLAIGSKEMALSLPAVFLLYEVLLHPPASRAALRQWIRENAARIGPSALVCAAFAAGRMWVPGPLTGHVAYTPVFTVARLLENATAYSRILLSGAVAFTPVTALVFWAACIAVAAVLRSRLMLLGVLSFLAGMLPLAFVTPRTSGYVFYVPLLGLSLYVAGAFQWVRARLSAGWPRTAWTVAYVCSVVGLHYWQAAPSIRFQAGPGAAKEIREMCEQIPRLCPQLAPGARVLLLDSPLDQRYVPMFVLSLLYRTTPLTVVNASVEPERVSERYDHIFVYKDGVYSIAQVPVFDHRRFPLGAEHAQ